MSFTPLNFRGNVTGLFYVKSVGGTETVPIALADTTVTIDNGTMSPTGQEIIDPEQWATWQPNSGPLSIAFSDGSQVRQLWVTMGRYGDSPPVVGVWASNVPRDLWAQGQQTSTPTPPPTPHVFDYQAGIMVMVPIPDTSSTPHVYDYQAGIMVMVPIP